MRPRILGNKTVQKIVKWLLALSFFSLLHAQAQAEAVEAVIDASGQSLRLPAPAQRIITLTPHATELVYSAGAGEHLVATVEYSDYPEAAQRLPRVGGYGGFNIEAIMALQADLIIYWPGGNPQRELNKIRQLNIPLFASNPQTFADIASEIDSIARLTGHLADAQPALEQFQQQVLGLQQRYQGKTPVRVFYQIWHQPLLSQNGRSFISRVIELCGGRNIVANLPMLTPQVSIEAVLAANPDIILASSEQGQAPSWLAQWQRYPSLKAVRHQQLKTVDSNLIQRPTLRLLEGAKQVCQLLDEARQLKSP